MELHQVVVSAAPHDAVTNSALAIRELLRTVTSSDLFARNIHPELEGDVMALQDLARGGSRPLRSSDVVIFHGSIGDDATFDVVWELPCRVILLYHNVSPAYAYRPYDPAFAEVLRRGRQQIAQLRSRVETAFAPSPYNARELVAMGYQDVRATPLIIDTHHLQHVEPDPAVVAELDAIDGPLFFFLGQMLPHKRPDFLLQAFHFLTTYLLPGSHLAMVGASRLPLYRQRLDAFIQELNLPGLHFPGDVSDAALAAYFRRADVFVTASEHEGFCVPLIEAMGFGLPVAARAAAAVPETLQGAGLCVPVGDGPALFADTILEVTSNEALRRTLQRRGRERAADFAPETARATFLRTLLDVL